MPLQAPPRRRAHRWRKPDPGPHLHRLPRPGGIARPAPTCVARSSPSVTIHRNPGVLSILAPKSLIWRENGSVAGNRRSRSQRSRISTGTPRSTTHDCRLCERVGSSVAFGRRVVVPPALEFMALHPQVQFDLSFEDRYTDPVAPGIDVAIRMGKLADSALGARYLGVNPWLLVASPGYLKGRPAPACAPDLRDHDALVYSRCSRATGCPSRKSTPCSRRRGACRPRCSPSSPSCTGVSPTAGGAGGTRRTEAGTRWARTMRELFAPVRELHAPRNRTVAGKP